MYGDEEEPKIFLYYQVQIGVGKKLEVKEYPKKNCEMPLQCYSALRIILAVLQNSR